MRKNAPHLVKDLSFVIPSYDWWSSPFYGLGLKIYDMMAGSLGLGPSTILSKEETLELIPNVNKKDLEEILNLGKSSKNNYLENIDKKLNSTNKTGVLLFEKPSLRTKLSFFKALNYLGINPIYFDPKEVGMGGREKISDIANQNFTAEQQIALENSRAVITLNFNNLNSRQALTMAEASGRMAAERQQQRQTEYLDAINQAMATANDILADIRDNIQPPPGNVPALP